MKYAFIESQRRQFDVACLCAALDVSRSGYYAWRTAAGSRRAAENAALATKMRALHRQTREAYGARKMWRALQAEGVACGKHRVARLRRLYGIETLRHRRFRRAYAARQGTPPAPNLLRAPFAASGPNQVWVGDITFVPTRAGWLYLAALVDVYSRQIVGWAMGSRPTRGLVSDALMMAIQRRCPQPGLIHHSDQGIQYASGEFRQLLADHGITQSMSRKGNCYDNAVAESFFSTLKNEMVHHRDFMNREQARREIFEFIEVFYNRQRLHQSLDYRTPVAFEAEQCVA